MMKDTKINCDILNEIDYYTKNYPDNSSVLSRIRASLQEIAIKKNEKYSLVFVAEKGKGKTTIINYLLGLNYDKEKIKEKTGRKYEVIEEVLETGAGATTTSEVEICQSLDEVTHIKIIPYTIEETKELLELFSTIIFNDTFNLNREEQSSLPTELIRACRNLTGLKENKKNKIDEAKNLAKNYNVDDYDKFKEEVIRRANLEERTKTNFSYELGNENEKEWLKKEFRKINLVHEKDANIPKKVIIEISKEIFNFSKFKNINKIIDTRGLEVGSITDRSDIKKLFRGEDNNIIVFVDEFTSPSKAIIDLLDHYVYDKDMDCIDRLAYIVNFHDGEPKDVIDCNGEVEDEIQGIEEKRGQIIQVFKENNINFKYENMVYVNPRRFLKNDGVIGIEEEDYDIYGEDASKAKIISEKKNIREIERKAFEEEIINILEEYKIKLENKEKEILEKYNDIKNEIDKASTIDLSILKEKIYQKVFSFKLGDNIVNMYDNYIASKYPSTLMAINNRCGIYNSNDIFCEGANYIENCIKGTLKAFKDDIILFLFNIKNTEILNNNQKNSIEFIVQDINTYFFRYVELINNYFSDKLKDKIYSEKDEVFWSKVVRRWGKGSGYRLDIMNYYKENIVLKKFNEQVDEDMENLLNSFKTGLIDVINKAN